MRRIFVIMISVLFTVLLLELFLGCINLNVAASYIDGSIVVDGVKRMYHLFMFQASMMGES